MSGGNPTSRSATCKSVSPGAQGRWIERLTWSEAEQAIKRLHTILIPVGAACKEHGLHLPLNTDWVVANYLAERIVQQCAVLALPTVSYGYYPAFLEYPGSVSIAAGAFEETIADICRSFARHGARKFYVLNTGISTRAPLEAARAALSAEGISMAYSDAHLAASARRSVERQPFGTHADEIETSVMLYIAPQLVRMELAAPELTTNHPGALTRNPAGPGVYSATGAWGDPTLAMPEKGRIMVEAIIGEIMATLAV
ncbi:MAG TPA: creatininase family protein [Tepidisphaeraceae bacterium]|jgi:creatinine amidohydrolase|nr:creatininase family protein [Tepidisphaeraceae bacterium]